MSEQRRPLVIIFLVIFIDLLGFGIVLPLLPVFASELGADDVTIGLLLASFSAMQFLFSPIWGRVSDRVGRRPILLLGLFGSVVCYALFGYACEAGNLAMAFVARIGAGVAGATIATAQAYIADSTTADRRTAGMAIVGAAFGLGFIFGPILGALAVWLAPSTGYVTGLPGYMAAGLSAVAFGLAVAILPESLRSRQSPQPRSWLRWHDFRLARRHPAVGRLILVFFLATLVFAGFESTIARLAKDVFQLELRDNFLLFAYFGFCLTVAQGGVRSLTRRITTERISLLGTAGLLIGMIGLAGAAEVTSIVFLFVATVVLIVGFAFLTTATQSMISLRSGAQEQGGVLGLTQSASSLSRIIGPVVGNLLYGLRPTAPYWSGGAVLAVILLVLVWLPPARIPPNSDDSA